MREKLRGMHPGVRPSAAGGFDGLAQDGGQGLIQQLLHRHRVGLNLPAMVIGAIIAQFDKIALFFGHERKGNGFTNYD